MTAHHSAEVVTGVEATTIAGFLGDPSQAVLDASAMLAFLRDEDGADVVRGLLLDPAVVCCAHAVNVCEVFYDARRAVGEEAALADLERLYVAGVELRADMDPDFWHDVGRLKSDPPGKALADCFGLALTRRLDGEFVTSDHGELDALVPLNLCRIRFFR